MVEITTDLATSLEVMAWFIAAIFLIAMFIVPLLVGSETKNSEDAGGVILGCALFVFLAVMLSGIVFNILQPLGEAIR